MGSISHLHDGRSRARYLGHRHPVCQGHDAASKRDASANAGRRLRENLDQLVYHLRLISEKLWPCLAIEWGTLLRDLFQMVYAFAQAHWVQRSLIFIRDIHSVDGNNMHFHMALFALLLILSPVSLYRISHQMAWNLLEAKSCAKNTEDIYNNKKWMTGFLILCCLPA